ncbi:MAG: MazF family transcriptional regulator [Acidobacteria bacterium]|nr:MazF family transcriptional regulator [Acidobacteriota bacterium]
MVLIPFPFSDLSNSKLRPAVVLAASGRGDWVLCQITSHPYSDARSIAIETDDLRSGALRLRSYARPSKLFTANEALITRVIGDLTGVKRSEVLTGVISLFQGALP